MIKFITYCPDNIYFHWQTEVFLTNFIEHQLEDINVVFMIKGEASQGLKAIMKKYPQVNWFTYRMDRHNHYLAANWFTGLRLHNPQGWLFYHDADMIFMKRPDIEKLSALDQSKAYGSNTGGYNSAKYIKSKSEEVFKGMCKIVGVTAEFIEARDHQVCGAQWIFPGMGKDFWAKCERDALALYDFIDKHPSQKYEMLNGKKVNPITKQPAQLVQKTAAMWSILWNFWKAGIETEIIPELEFSFATAPAEKCTNIMHNAGVVDRTQKKMFAKLNYVGKSPIGERLDFDPAFAAWHYSEAIKKVKR